MRKLRNVKGSRRNKTTTQSACAAEMQTLESRQLLSATMSNGTLTIQSEPQSRAVPRTVVSEQRGQITVWQNGQQKSFPQNQVRQIVFQGTNQKDIFENRSSKPTTVYGNGGNDFLEAGYGRNTIYGGSGHDTIRFSRGGGVAYGGSGNDTISAQNRNVSITAFGQRGNDSIWGGNKNDRLYGGAGNDRLHGGAGNDRIHGGRGNDLLNDGDGRDVVIGGAGQDRFEMTVGYRDDGDNDLLSLGSRHELRSERHFASIDYWFSVNGWLDERNV